jgi:hypothetical protein
MRAARQDAADVCVVMVDRLAAGRDEAHTDAAQLHDDLGGVLDVALPAVDDTHPLLVHETSPPDSPAETTVTLASADQDFLKGNAQAVRSDLWFFLGAALSLFFGSVLLRKVLP